MTGAGVAGTRAGVAGIGAGVAVTGADVAARVRLAVLPTPLVPAPRLAEVVGARALYVKRDDLTGFAFAGNKARPLEFLLAVHRIWSGGGKAPAFRRREMLAYDIDFFDGRAASDQRGMKLLKILERDAGVERLFDEGGATAGNQEKYQRALGAAR